MSEEFNDVLLDFCKRKLDYGYSELQRIKDRAHQIVAFFLVISSIISASLTATSIDKILGNNLIIGVLIVGFGLVILTMTLSFKIMIGRQKNPLIDPRKLYEFYQGTPINETKETIRDTIFGMFDNIDKRNDQLHEKMLKIYHLAIISLVIIFIPMIWLIIIR